MSALEDLTSGPGGMAGIVGALSRRFRPVTRRNLLVGATVAAAALATKPKEYALRPVGAYATICGPGNVASAGWTVFCCTINKGVNACPPGSFAAGWWKAADSSWCGRGYRYIVDCNASCSRCTTGCGTSGLCSSSCWSCSCGSGSTATCDQRRVCCNAFRYGQCNTQVKCSGGVHCRVVSCVAPYKWANCTTTSLVDNRTSEHSAPCLPAWGAIEQRYMALGDQASYLKASTGPNRSVGDRLGGVYVTYQGGAIYWTSGTGAQPVGTLALHAWSAIGGVSGPLGYPTASQVANPDGIGWHQQFQGGLITASTGTQAVAVAAPISDVWVQNGREGGPLGYPTDIRRSTGSTWLQLFEHGAIAGSSSTPTVPVAGVMYAGWVANGGPSGLLGYPVTSVARGTQGGNQQFQGGELWALHAGPARLVYGSVLTTWKNAGGAAGAYGYPLTDCTATGDGRLTCTFEHGTITV